MITEISRDINVEEIPEKKKFLISLNIVQESDPEDLLKNLEGIRSTIKSDEETLKIKREQIEDNIKKNKEIELHFIGAEKTARLWKTENELMAKRTGKNLEEIQQHKEIFVGEE